MTSNRNMQAAAWLSAVLLLPSASASAADTRINMMNGDNDGLDSGRGLVPHLETLG
ncbi:MAG: hypothetical protein ACT4UP_11380 [Gammaproteobacteria bacterium]